MGILDLSEGNCIYIQRYRFCSVTVHRGAKNIEMMVERDRDVYGWDNA